MVKKLIVHGNLVWGILVLVLVGVFLVAPVQAQVATPQMMPGMPFIAKSAINAPMLAETLTGQIPATIPEYTTMPDPTGQITTYNLEGPTHTATNGFFIPNTATNGRTCFTCHQPQNDWEISPPQIIAEFLLTEGKSVLFHPINAANCPDLPGVTAPFWDPRFVLTRTQLFTRGNFRIGINAPNPLGIGKPGYTTFDGNTNPEWVLTVAYDPYGCETDKTYGLPANLVGVYRRPLNSANVVFLVQDPGYYQNTGPPTAIPPS